MGATPQGDATPEYRAYFKERQRSEVRPGRCYRGRLVVRCALDRPAKAPPVAAPVATNDTRERERNVLRCRACDAEIADEDDRIEMSGAHAHTFVNPHGHVFEVGCFARAPGCAPLGPASAFFSWFPGYAWRVVVCAQCRTHLGWSFGEAPDFFGLVLPRLV